MHTQFYIAGNILCVANVPRISGREKKCIWLGIVDSDWKSKKNKDNFHIGSVGKMGVLVPTLFHRYSLHWLNKKNLSAKYNCVVCVCCIIFDFETSWKMFSQKGGVCNRFEITFVSEKHVVEDNVLFTNHLARK